MVGYAWNFGDASASSRITTAKTTHTYTKKAIYAVTLTVWDAQGQSDDIVKNVKVDHVP